jgi:putative ABC transport system permease protein
MNEGWTQAFRQLKADRFRTLLSLLGVAIGIFSIVAALTLVDSVQKSVHDGFAAFGSDLLFIEREPLEPDLNEDGVFRWWEYVARPPITWREYDYLSKRSCLEQIGFAAYGPETVGVDGSWCLLVPQPLAQGRPFTQRELEEGLPVVIVGSAVETATSGPLACGAPLWLEGKRYEVIGVFAKAGMTTVSPVDVDEVRLVPFKSQRQDPLRSSIIVSGANPERIRTIMREYRRLGPLQSDNFALNRLSFLLDEMNEIFSLVAKLGWIVGIFSLLVGGFGIANMLYVSVEERKPQIGICRALGAKRKVILREFLTEASLLSLLGAAAGIVLVQLMLIILRFAGGGTNLPLSLSATSVAAGLTTSLIIGLAFGVAPAKHASTLHPVDAINDR